MFIIIMLGWSNLVGVPQMKTHSIICSGKLIDSFPDTSVHAGSTIHSMAFESVDEVLLHQIMERLEQVQQNLDDSLDDLVDSFQKTSDSLDSLEAVTSETLDMVSGLAKAAKNREMKREYGRSCDADQDQ